MFWAVKMQKRFGFYEVNVT